jgi:hypothetical protein
MGIQLGEIYKVRWIDRGTVAAISAEAERMIPTQVLKILLGFTLSIDLIVLLVITATTGRALEWIIEKGCRRRDCFSFINQWLLQLLLWAAFWLGWTAVIFVIIILILSVGLVGT